MKSIFDIVKYGVIFLLLVFLITVTLANAQADGDVVTPFISPYLQKQSAPPTKATCRSQKVVRQFHKLNGFPKGRPGFIVDHICALDCGGIDSPINMQYQTKTESVRKDRWERTPEGCASTCFPFNSTKIRTVFNCNSR